MQDFFVFCLSLSVNLLKSVEFRMVAIKCHLLIYLLYYQAFLGPRPLILCYLYLTGMLSQSLSSKRLLSCLMHGCVCVCVCVCVYVCECVCVN